MLFLCAKLRPKVLGDFVGQEHLVGSSGIFQKFIAKNKFPHSFFYGPPGSGKTTLVRIIASLLGRIFYEFNASSLKIEDVRKAIEAHKNSFEAPLIFIDEAHRLNKTQQDVLLPIMEEARALVIGASTENPFFALTSGIRSRVMLFEFLPHNANDMEKLALKGAKELKISLDNDAMAKLISTSNGDARVLLKTLEYASLLDSTISTSTIDSLLQKESSEGSNEDETHYNLTSAMIKSVRGSDPDAAVYYLARLIASGEEPRFIARRLLILASEDIGNANPNALVLANAAFEATSNIGYPEARIILSQIAIYLACSPKSNVSYLAINNALTAVNSGEILPIPDYLKDANSITKRQGKGKDYLYPHDFGGWIAQEYLAKPLSFITFNGIGFEKTLAEWLTKIRSTL